MRSSDKFEAILNSITDGLFTVDSDWKITFFNRAAEKITGVPHDEALGRNCSEVFRASICEGGCALRYTIQTGKPVVNKAVYIIDSKGNRVPISISTALLRDKNRNIIGGAESFRDLSQVERLRKELESRYAFEDIVSKSALMQRIFDILPAIARSESTVLIVGDSGTGKELLARAIHNLSPRKNKPMVSINCGALPDTLLESELFGYKPGAFTDARKEKPGRFAMAEGGTIFLDEIGDVSPALQVRLLRVLQERTFEPLGGLRPVKANVRVIAATNKSLEEMVENGEFRQDLYYRINVIKLETPPLIQRREDIPLLADHFIGKFNQLRGKDIDGISAEALRILLKYQYPGNVRELENFIEHAFVLCDGGMIKPEHLPEILRRETAEIGGEPIATVQDFETKMINSALRRNHWNRAAAAEELGMHKTTLYRKIRKLRIELLQIDGRAKRRRER